MKLTLAIDVISCARCPLRQQHRGHGECWDYCSHPSAPRGYGNIIPEGGAFPAFCPGLPPIANPTGPESDRE